MSQTIRAYLPATLRTLAALRDRGALPAGEEAYAVTPALREQLGEDDPEELSYAAFRLAAQVALARLQADPAAPRRRVVISADVPAEPGGSAEPGGGGRVRLTAPVRLAAVAAIHVDGVAAEPEVAAAVAAGADAADPELEWYDVSELAQLLA